MYWWWNPSWNPNRLAAVRGNALAPIDLNPTCLPKAEATCAKLSLVPNGGGVTRSQAAAGRGEINVTCSPALEQS